MLHPVGSEPSSVYWRRRLILLGAIALVIVLIALTVHAVTGSSSTPQAGGSSSGPGARTSGAATASRTSTPRTSAAATSSPAATSKGAASSSGSATGSVAPAVCKPSNLKVAAVVGKSTYNVGDKLLVELQVTNTGPTPCVQDLSDKQIELRVYNGSSRVWGSHDCAVQPGTDLRTLAAGQPYRSAVLWGGLTSEPKCTQATRQRIGAGTYTLYAALAGKTGTAAQFNVS